MVGIRGPGGRLRAQAQKVLAEAGASRRPTLLPAPCAAWRKRCVHLSLVEASRVNAVTRMYCCSAWGHGVRSAAPVTLLHDTACSESLCMPCIRVDSAT
jgi:hypothetical protein